MRVANRKCIRRLAFQNLRSAKLRNFITITAIALTTILFTALFTIVLSIVESFQQSNFRQVGTSYHGAFKDLSKEQFDLLKEDPLIKEWGLRRVIGIANDDVFNKSQVEVSFMDESYSKRGFCVPSMGSLPKEGTNEAATDLKVLSLLGVEPKLGNEFTVTIDVDGAKVKETFTLCGFWEYDEVAAANNIVIPESRVEEMLKEYNPKNSNGITGTYQLNVMLSNASSIEADFNAILSKYGYQQDDQTKDNYIHTGVNWGYVSAQISDSINSSLILGMAAALILIIFTGYLIIYNIFQISVANDIRHYGLLKTIGTTGKQIKKLVLLQTFMLSVAGIPIGLILGYGIGALLMPFIMRVTTIGYHNNISVSPYIFIGAVIFSVVTVLISCRKPSRIAGKVSPMEVLRYTESQTYAKKRKKTRKASKKGVSLLSMAFANMGRNRKKTFVTVLSMSLSIVLFILAVTFTNGFNMEKYVSKNINTDYIVADASYFNTMKHWSNSEPVSDELPALLKEKAHIAEGGKTYGQTTLAYDFVTEDYLSKSFMSKFPGFSIKKYEKENGLYLNQILLYGMDDFCLDKLVVYDGDISRLKTGENVIAAVYYQDDYENRMEHTNWVKTGDIVKIRHIETYEYYDTNTGNIYSEEELNNVSDFSAIQMRIVSYQDIEYEVVAVVAVPSSLNYRYYGNDQFVLGSKRFIEDTGTSNVMYYTFDMEDDEAEKEKMETFLADYTKNVNPNLDYESRYSYAAEFESFRNMFLFMGSILSFIVGLIGILNFLNAVLTGIITRHREFAMLQSIGMTGKQLKKMLVLKGLYYTLGSVIVSFLLAVMISPLTAQVLENMFWFFDYKFTAAPLFITAPIFAVLGVMLPLVSYRFFAKKSIVERLREVE